jgi:hypothetical protein
MITKMDLRKGGVSHDCNQHVQSPLAHLRDVYLRWAAAYPPSIDLHCLLVIPLDSPTPGFKLKNSSNISNSKYIFDLKIVAVFEKRLLTISLVFWKVILRQVPDCGAGFLDHGVRRMHKTKTVKLAS